MMNVLDALRHKLTPPGTTDLEGEPLDPRILEMLGRSPRQLPPGLPLVVRDSILNRPSYQEGDRYPARKIPGEPGNLPADDPNNREYRLNELLDFNAYMRRNSQLAWPEGSFATPLKPGQSPYATPGGPSPGMDYLPGGATNISAGSVPTPGEQAFMDEQLQAHEAQQRQQRAALSHLPQAVQDSILNRPSYAEGDPVPYIYGDRSLDEEARAYQSPQRDRELGAALWAKREVPGANAPRLYPDPLSSPLNQMMRRGPFGQY